MPVLSSPRHERFAQELAKGRTADEAYQIAGYAENRHNASRLKTKETILARVAELQQLGAEKAAVTVESLIDEAAVIQARALEKEQFGPAVAALTAKAKLAGHWVEKREDVTARRTPEQIYARLNQIIDARAAERGGGTDRGVGLEPQDDAALPTVPGHGTA